MRKEKHVPSAIALVQCCCIHHIFSARYILLHTVVEVKYIMNMHNEYANRRGH